MKATNIFRSNPRRASDFLRALFCALLTCLALPATSVTSSAETLIIIPPPTTEVSVLAVDPGASEAGPTSGAFTVFRAGPITDALTVFFSVNGSAIEGEDFEPIGTTVTIPAGATSATVLVKPIADTVVERLETVRLTLIASPVATPLEPYRVGFPDSAEVTIADANPPPPTNRPPEVRLISPFPGAFFRTGSPIFLEAGAHDPDGWVARVEFFAGTNLLGSATNNPDLRYFANPFRFTWADAPVGEHVLTVRAYDNRGLASVSPPVSIRVGEDPEPPPVVAVVGIVAVDEHATEPSLNAAGFERPDFVDTARFRIERRGWTNGPLVVSYRIEGTASNGVDYALLPGVLTIPAGETTAFIDIVPLADSEPEGIETVTVILEAPICIAIYPPPPGCYRVDGPSRATVFIHDAQVPTNPPPPVVTIVASEPQAAEEGSRPGRFTVTRAGDTNAELFVNLAIGGRAINGLDYLPIEPFVRIPAGAASADIVITPVDDAFAEGPESVEIGIVPPIMPLLTGTPAGMAWWMPPPYVIGTPANAVVVILDNDGAPTNLPPNVRWLAPREGSVFRAGATIQLAVEARDPDGSITLVEFYSGTNLLGTASTPAGATANAPMRPGLPPLGPYFMTWPNVSPGEYLLTARVVDDAGAAAVAPPVPIRVLTNEPPPPPPTPTNHPVAFTIRAIDAYASEGTNALGMRNTAVFRVRRTGDTNSDVTVSYAISGTASNGVDYLELPGTVTIPSGQRHADIVVVPIDDDEIEPVETVVLTLIQPVAGDQVIGGPSLNELTALGTPGGDRAGRELQRAVAFIADNDGPRPPTQQSRDGFFHVTRNATNGFHYRVEVSTNFTGWLPVHTNTVLDGAVHFIDPAGSVNGLRFYRIVPQPVDSTPED